MKKLSHMGLLLLLSLLWGYSDCGNATIVITSIEARGNGGFKDYKVTWARIPGPLDNQIIPSNVRYFGAMEEHDRSAYACNSGGSTLFPGIQGTMCVDVPSDFTWKQTEEKWLSTYGANGPGIVGHYGRADSRECVMFAGQQSRAEPIGRQANNGPLVCVNAPPTTIEPQCVIEASPIFDFTANLGQNTTGMTQTATTNLRCNVPVSVTLMDATGYNGKIQLSNWGYAEVKINGQTLPLNISMSSSSSPLEISATLNGTATETGLAQGTLVLVVGYQ